MSDLDIKRINVHDRSDRKYIAWDEWKQVATSDPDLTILWDEDELEEGDDVSNERGFVYHTVFGYSPESGHDIELTYDSINGAIGVDGPDEEGLKKLAELASRLGAVIETVDTDLMVPLDGGLEVHDLDGTIYKRKFE